ncbi:Hypothetical predicted protein, partial [Olea europaea subsp. europaea]
MWIFGRKGPSGFSSSSTADEVTQGIDGSGLTAIVTGASSGIGTETTRVLALRGVHVIMAVRNMDSGRKVKEAIIKEIPDAKIDIMELDLSSMSSVRKFASEYNCSGLPLNILINNAGVMAPPFMESEDKIELQFATNHLGLASWIAKYVLKNIPQLATSLTPERHLRNFVQRDNARMALAWCLSCFSFSLCPFSNFDNSFLSITLNLGLETSLIYLALHGEDASSSCFDKL